MKKRFVIALDSGTSEQDKAFQDYIESTNVAWWHWIKNVWLIGDNYDRVTAKGLRDKVCEIYPRIDNVVLELREDGDTWSGYGPNQEPRNMFKWLLNNWHK